MTVSCGFMISGHGRVQVCGFTWEVDCVCGGLDVNEEVY